MYLSVSNEVLTERNSLGVTKTNCYAPHMCRQQIAHVPMSKWNSSIDTHTLMHQSFVLRLFLWFFSEFCERTSIQLCGIWPAKTNYRVLQSVLMTYEVMQTASLLFRWLTLQACARFIGTYQGQALQARLRKTFRIFHGCKCQRFRLSQSGFTKLTQGPY